VTDACTRFVFTVRFWSRGELLRFFMAVSFALRVRTGSLPHPVRVGLLIPSRTKVGPAGPVRRGRATDISRYRPRSALPIGYQ
jgi:hypothetical protein